jgi:serine/threonine protein kinase
MCSGEYSIPDSIMISKGCTDLLSKIFKPNPSDRICMNDIFEHPWFREKLPEQAKSRLYTVHPHFAARHAHLSTLLKANEARGGKLGRISGRWSQNSASKGSSTHGRFAKKEYW